MNNDFNNVRAASLDMNSSGKVVVHMPKRKTNSSSSSSFSKKNKRAPHRTESPDQTDSQSDHSHQLLGVSAASSSNSSNSGESVGRDSFSFPRDDAQPRVSQELAANYRLLVTMSSLDKQGVSSKRRIPDLSKLRHDSAAAAASASAYSLQQTQMSERKLQPPSSVNIELQGPSPSEPLQQPELTSSTADADKAVGTDEMEPTRKMSMEIQTQISSDIKELDTDFHTMTTQKLEAVLRTDIAKGLPEEEAKARLAKDGPNTIKIKNLKWIPRVIGYFFGGFTFLLWPSVSYLFIYFNIFLSRPAISLSLSLSPS